VIAYRYRDYHNGTGSRVFLTENPGRYSRRGKDGQSSVGVVVAGRRWGRTSGDDLDHGEADLAGDELDR
jgi:hypothetical protein